MAASNEAINIATSGSLYPDHVVFLGPSTLLVNSKSEFNNLKNFIHQFHKPPIILFRDLGVLVPKNITQEAEEMVIALSRVISNIPDNAKVKYLTRKEEDDLINWSSEIYRLKINNSN